MTAMSDQELLDRAERAARGIALPDGRFDDLLRRRDRKRRHQRIAAGIVGIAVFVAAIWIVTSGGAFDRSTSAVPGGSETGPTQTAPRPALASAAPDVVSRGTCSFVAPHARSHLELTDVGGYIEVRFEVHEGFSTDDALWHIKLRHHRPGTTRTHGVVFFRDTRRTRGDSGDIVVTRRVPDWAGADAFSAKAVDTGNGQLCRVYAELR
jgi:hypothetical protein